MLCWRKVRTVHRVLPSPHRNTLGDSALDEPGKCLVSVIVYILLTQTCLSCSFSNQEAEELLVFDDARDETVTPADQILPSDEQLPEAIKVRTNDDCV